MAISSSRVDQSQGGNLLQQMSADVIDIYKHSENLAQTRRMIDVEERKQKAALLGPMVEKLIQDRGGTYAFLRSSPEAAIVYGNFLMETTGMKANQVASAVQGIMSLDPTHQDMFSMLANKAVSDPKAATMLADLTNRANYSNLRGKAMVDMGGDGTAETLRLAQDTEAIFGKLTGYQPPPPPKEEEKKTTAQGDERARGTTVSGGEHAAKQEMEAFEAEETEKRNELYATRYGAYEQKQVEEHGPEITQEDTTYGRLESEEKKLLGLAEQNPQYSEEFKALAKLHRSGELSPQQVLEAATKVPELKEAAMRALEKTAEVQGRGDPMVTAYYRDYYKGKKISDGRTRIAIDRQATRMEQDNHKMLNQFYETVYPHIGDIDYMRKVLPDVAASVDKSVDYILKERTLQLNESQDQLAWKQFVWQKGLQMLQLETQTKAQAAAAELGMVPSEIMGSLVVEYNKTLQKLIGEGKSEEDIQSYIESNPVLKATEEAMRIFMSQQGIEVTQLERRAGFLGLLGKQQYYQAQFIGQGGAGVNSSQVNTNMNSEASAYMNSYGY